MAGDHFQVAYARMVELILRQSERNGALGETPPRADRTDLRYKKGRNRQFSINATQETIDSIRRISSEMNLPMAAVFELALEALEDTLVKERTGT